MKKALSHLLVVFRKIMPFVREIVSKPAKPPDFDTVPMKKIIISTPKKTKIIGPGNPTFVIAEMSANHNQNFDRAVMIIKAAAEAGVDAIKLQTYTSDSLTINSNKKWFAVGGGDNPESWDGKTLYDVYEKAYTPRDWHLKLKEIAEELGLIFFSTPFHPKDVDFLETLNVPLYKIASYEVTDIPLLKRIAQTGKPVLMSVGFASLDEIELAVKTLRENGTSEMGIFHCVTAYSKEPKPEYTNLRTMLDLSERFNVICGFSDNNAGIEIPLQAVMMGASMIEKHIIVDDEETFDSNFSISSGSFKEFVKKVRDAEKIMGKVNYGVQSPIEEYNKRYRKSIFVVENIKKSDIFTTKNIKVIRPAFGLEPKYYEEILGKIANQDIEKGTPLQKGMFE